MFCYLCDNLKSLSDPHATMGGDATALLLIINTIVKKDWELKKKINSNKY